MDRAVVATLGADSIRAMGRGADIPSETQSLETILFGGGDSVAGGDSVVGGDSAQVQDSTQARDSAQAPAEEAETPAAQQPQTPAGELRPITALLNQGDSEGTYFVAEEDVAVLKGFLALPEVQVAMPREVALQWGSEPVEPRCPGLPAPLCSGGPGVPHRETSWKTPWPTGIPSTTSPWSASS